MTIAIRNAHRGDLDGIVSVFLDCWRTSYAATLPASLVGSMTPSVATELWTRVLDETALGEVVVVESTIATRPVVGVTRWALLDETDDGSSHEAVGAVHSLYVSPAAQGQGIGGRLLGEAISRLTDRGVSVIHLWVFRDNAPSVAFYRRRGWLPDGEQRVEEQFGEPEIRLTLAMAPAVDSP